MLKLGSSKPWPEALEQITGQTYMDASALLEYFKPLHEWLTDQNTKSGGVVGWSSRVDGTLPYFNSKAYFGWQSTYYVRLDSI